MRALKIAAFAIALLMSCFIYQSCKQLKDITQTFTDLQRLQFKLENVNNFKLNGVNLSNKSSIKDFSISDGFKLTQAFTGKKLPAEFTLNVAAINPNDGKNNSRKTVATLTGLDWRLFIDDKETISGGLGAPVEVPASGQSTIIPLYVSMDLYKFFAEKGYDGVVNLALSLGGVNGSAARLKLDAQPTISTPIGAISSPRITIIDKEFR